MIADRSAVVKYLVKAMRFYKDKEMLNIPYSTVNHWILVTISTMYDQVWYCDSSRPADPDTGERLTRDYDDVISIINE